ncbi:hypothetical protein J4G43_031665 [Bradyrhizobium barranii subsp. barranii]|uniref:Uncharacterized protein n=1 Tax=Bradyrhizobium barranii subsp. barranii TaxID=2823807 RepID=A0A9X9XNP1_9BRAD|nr:hypothetical protein [Bradyrhizobium barranii]UEM09285.1 hypothetical protein J4G43_031665 [Bradyrhizobium barranii subsp. barranii]
MAPLPRPFSATTEAIYAAYAKSRSQAWDSLGISISLLGEECERALWYTFRWASKPEVIDGLKAITFETGEIEETRLLNALRMIGCEVDEFDRAASSIAQRRSRATFAARRTARCSACRKLQRLGTLSKPSR